MKTMRFHPWMGFLLVAAAVYVTYSLGFRGEWQFDDAVNLGDLSYVKDLDSALAFVFGGLSSDIGRPLALTTFLMNGADWPCCTEGFRRVNVLIHLFNGLLVYLLARRSLSLVPEASRPTGWAAAVLAGIWMAHPLLVSTSMLVVQRMTSLSATFVLLGLLGYLHGRRHLLAGSLGRGYAWVSASLAGGALLGVLAKETAALLPLFAAVAEFTVLGLYRSMHGVPYWRWWRWVFFGTPVLLLLAYGAYTWDGIRDMAVSRPFDLPARLASESVILWDYLRQIFAPDIFRMGPYQDDAPVRHWNEPLVLVATAAWIALAAGAWKVRRKWPWAAFALGWFWVGHLLESTVFPLELYFEHRNYLPALGPLALLVAALWRLPARTLVPAGVVLMGGVLLLNAQVTSLWGRPALAAAAWYTAHPTSSRAAGDLANRFVAVGQYDQALRALEPSMEAHPLDGDFQMVRLLVHCLAGDAEGSRRQFESLSRQAGELEPGNRMAETLHRIVRLQRDGRCEALGDTELLALTEALLANPGIRANPRHRHVLHIVAADMERQRRHLDATVGHLRAAFQAWPQIEVAQIYIFDLVSAGLGAEARSEIERVRTYLPGNPWIRQYWLAKLDELEDLVAQHAAPPAPGR